MSDIKGVLAKVRALRALADSNTSEGEARTAAAQADALLQKHRLTEAQVGIAQDPIVREQVLAARRRAIVWHRLVVQVLAEHYGCLLLGRRTGGVSETYIAGRTSDVETVQYMTAWLVATITRLCNAKGQQRPRWWRSDYCNGAVVGFRSTLQSAAESARAEHAQQHGHSAALVLANRQDEARAWLEQLQGAPVKTKNGGSVVATHREAYATGHHDGARIDAGVDAAALGQGARALPEGAR